MRKWRDEKPLSPLFSTGTVPSTHKFTPQRKWSTSAWQRNHIHRTPNFIEHNQITLNDDLKKYGCLLNFGVCSFPSWLICEQRPEWIPMKRCFALYKTVS